MTGDKTPVEGNSGSDTAGAGPTTEPAEPPEPAESLEADTAAAADAVTLAPPAAAASTGAVTTSPALDFPTPTVPAPPSDYSQAGVPSLDFVRDKIEGRYAKSLGATELAQETPEARSFEEQAAKRADAAKEKLDAIRRSLRGDSTS